MPEELQPSLIMGLFHSKRENRKQKKERKPTPPNFTSKGQTKIVYAQKTELSVQLLTFIKTRAFDIEV